MAQTKWRGVQAQELMSDSLVHKYFDSEEHSLECTSERRESGE